MLEIVSILVILASVITLCIESLPEYRLNKTDGSRLSTKGTPLFVAETVWTAFFTIEFIWRLMVSQEKTVSVKSACRHTRLNALEGDECSVLCISLSSSLRSGLYR